MPGYLTGPAAAGGGGAPTGAAGGDLGGLYPNPTVPTLAGKRADGLQNGVLNGTDAVVTGLAVSAAGVISGTMAAGTCWVVDAATSLLTRCAVPSGAFSLTPATLPAAGQFAVVCVDISLPTASGTPVLAASAKGTDQTTAALALSNSPATATGRVRLLDVVITNTTGTMSLSASRDRRPWARGACIHMVATADIVAAGALGVHLPWGAPFSHRLELTGVPFSIEARWTQDAAIGGNAHSHLYDGVQAATANAIYQPATQPTSQSYSYVRVAPVPGSHLVELGYSRSANMTMKGSATGYASVCTFREHVRQNASNGTA